MSKKAVIQKMMPEALAWDIKKDLSLKTYDATYNYILAQVPIRKELKKKGKGSDDMDVDALVPEKELEDNFRKTETEDPDAADLDTLKGAGKGTRFDGYCNHCWKWGHKRQDCRALTAELQTKGKSKSDEKGKGKGKDWKPSAGGWQTKGGGGKNWSTGSKGWGGKGKSSGGKVYSGQLYTNIDGYDGNYGNCMATRMAGDPVVAGFSC